MGNSIDRLSDLPDPILIHILSFLSTKEAVHTCVLSKRWKTLWTSVPVLKFDFKDFVSEDTNIVGNDEFLQRNNLHLIERRYNIEARFMKFVQGVLQNREALPVDKFWIHCSKLNVTSTSKVIEECIVPALKLKPRVLHATLPKSILGTFSSDQIFICTSLQDLHWDFPFEGTIPDTVNLPYLRKLHLKEAEFSDGCFSKLFAGCPMLVELFLSKCFSNTSTICSDHLRKLVFHDCYGEKKIQISAPNLLHLKFFVLRAFGISIQNMSSSMSTSFHSSELWHYRKVPAKQPMLLDGLSNATSLTLTVVCAQDDVCPDLSKLKGLTLRTRFAPKKTDWLAFLLNHSPNLKELTLCPKRTIFSYNLGNQWDAYMKEVWSQEEPKAVPLQREYLETIKIVRFSEDQSGFLMEDQSVNWLVNYLHAHVKSIGEIRVV